MPDLRRSLSMHWKKPKARQYHCISDPIEIPSQTDEDGHTRSSGESLIIRGRTRYPSNTIGQKSSPEILPIVHADQLVQLSEQPKLDNFTQARRRTSSLRRSLSENLLRLPTPLDGSLENPFLTPSASRVHSRNVSYNSSSGISAISHRASSCLSQPPASRKTFNFTESYNRLALECGLCPLEPFDEKGSPVPRHTRQRNWFTNKLSSNPAAKSTKDASHTGMGRKPSMTNLLGRQSKTSNKGHSLDTIFRLGGFSALYLPSSNRKAELLVPTPLAATAHYLLQQGDIGGIFRKPGSSNAVQALYDHYNYPLSDSSATSTERVETTIGSLQLPAHVPTDPHDVASAFKKFLWDVPGGILGSVALFKTMREIRNDQNPSLPRARLIALALLSLKSARRLDVICAVFGLLSCLKHDQTADKPSNHAPPLVQEQMTSRAFGVVFAPLLLGEIVDELDCSLTQKSPKKRGVFQFAKHKQIQATDRQSAMSVEKERMTMCGDVLELLINSWNDVTRQMYVLETVLHKPLPLPKMTFKEGRPSDRHISLEPPLASSKGATPRTPEPVRVPAAGPHHSSSHSPRMPAPAHTLCRSTSMDHASMRGPPTLGSMRQLSHSATAVDLRNDTRWPSQHSACSVDVPWWERKVVQSSPLMHSLMPKTLESSIRPVEDRPIRAKSGNRLPTIHSHALALEEKRDPEPREKEKKSPSKVYDDASGFDDIANDLVLPAPLFNLRGASVQRSRDASHCTSDHSSRNGSQKLKVSALYDEIMHLRQQLEVKSEEVRDLRTQMATAARSSKSSGLSYSATDMYETRQEIMMWKNRALLAEAIALKGEMPSIPSRKMWLLGSDAHSSEE